jgi:glycine cleavage system H protein
MQIPEALKYTEDHEWIAIDGDTVTIGITDYAQGELGDVVFVELPEVDAEFSAKDNCGEIEAVKTVADVYAPVSGVVTAVNDQLNDAPDLMNKDPYGEGWLLKLKLTDTAQVDTLLSAEQYQALIQ